MEEIQVHRFCDIDFTEENARVEGRRISWLVNGKPWVLDVCQKHGLEITLVEIDLYVEKYGHPEGAKPKPPKKAAQKAVAKPNGVSSAVPPTQSRTRPSKAKPLLGDYEIRADGRFVCKVPGSGTVCGQDFETQRGLKKHQTQTHPELAEEA